MTDAQSPRTRGRVQDLADGYLHVVLLILGGIRTTEERLTWVRRHLPMSAAMLDLGGEWEVMSALPSDGGGQVVRKGPASSTTAYKPKVCLDCGRTFSPTSGRQWRCRSCAERRSRRAKPPVRRRYRARRCVICDAVFRPLSTTQITCEARCQRQRLREKAREWWQATGSARQRDWYQREGRALRRAAL